MSHAIRFIFALLLHLVALDTVAAGELFIFAPTKCTELLTPAEPLPEKTITSRQKRADYEKRVALAYLAWRDDPNENVLLASGVGNWDFPAFDGLTLDAEGRRVDNISIKGVRVSGEFKVDPDAVAAKINRLAGKAVDQVSPWSAADRWDTWFRYTIEMIHEQMKTNPSRTLEIRRELLFIAKDLFATTVRRRTIVIVAITDEDGELADVSPEQIPTADLTALCPAQNGDVKSIVILAKNLSREIRPPGEDPPHVFPLREPVPLRN